MAKYKYVVVLFSMPERDSGCAEDIDTFDCIHEALEMKEILNGKYGTDDNFYEVTVRK